MTMPARTATRVDSDVRIRTVEHGIYEMLERVRADFPELTLEEICCGLNAAMERELRELRLRVIRTKERPW